MGLRYKIILNNIFLILIKITYNGKSVEYVYDDASRVTGIRYPNGKWVNYTYDDNARLVGVKDWNGKNTTFTYRKDGSIKQIDLPNGVKRIYEYDGAGRLVSLKDQKTDGTLICAYNIKKQDNVGNHTEVEITEPLEMPLLPNKNWEYGYNTDNNRLNKITDVTAVATLFEFEFDKNGRQTKQNNRLESQTAILAFDKHNHLTTYESPAFKATYEMDGNGQRRKATRNGVATDYVLSGMDVLAEYESGKETNYIHGVGLLYRISDSGKYGYYHYDPRGSTVAMTDESQTITHKYLYDEWGKVLKAEEQDLNRYRYVGQWGVMYEAEDLTYMRARYYSPVQKRFLSEDPIWHANLYPYADNNPIMKVDVNGAAAINAQDLTGFVGNYGHYMDVLGFVPAFGAPIHILKQANNALNGDITAAGIEGASLIGGTAIGFAYGGPYGAIGGYLISEAGTLTTKGVTETSTYKLTKDYAKLQETMYKNNFPHGACVAGDGDLVAQPIQQRISTGQCPVDYNTVITNIITVYGNNSGGYGQGSNSSITTYSTTITSYGTKPCYLSANTIIYVCPKGYFGNPY